MMRELFIAFALVAVSFAAPQYDTIADRDMKMDSETKTRINEYIKEYFKLTGRGVVPHEIPETTTEVKPERIQIRLYSSPEDVFESTLENWRSILEYPQFNTTLETKIYIHDWLEKDYHKISKMLSTLYAFRGRRSNFIAVDWSKYSSYTTNISHLMQHIVPRVAKYLVPMVQEVMVQQSNNRVHLIGFGVGAHIAGFVGKYVRGTKIARITGLSPPGTFYDTVPEEERLAKGDAEYVDVIHTNMGGAGISKRIGDVDFLPNGGRLQPAAEKNMDLTQAGKDVVSHMLARNYYVESIERGYGGFIGKKCDSWSHFLSEKCAYNETEIMGEFVSRRVNGSVYLRVNSEMKPYYSKGIYGLYRYEYPESNSYTTSTYHED